jgi:hypothetical protein
MLLDGCYFALFVWRVLRSNMGRSATVPSRCCGGRRSTTPMTRGSNRRPEANVRARLQPCRIRCGGGHFLTAVGESGGACAPQRALALARGAQSDFAGMLAGFACATACGSKEGTRTFISTAWLKPCPDAARPKRCSNVPSVPGFPVSPRFFPPGFSGPLEKREKGPARNVG